MRRDAGREKFHILTSVGNKVSRKSFLSRTFSATGMCPVCVDCPLIHMLHILIGAI